MDSYFLDILTHLQELMEPQSTNEPARRDSQTLPSPLPHPPRITTPPPSHQPLTTNRPPRSAWSMDLGDAPVAERQVEVIRMSAGDERVAVGRVI